MTVLIEPVTANLGVMINIDMHSKYADEVRESFHNLYSGAIYADLLAFKVQLSYTMLPSRTTHIVHGDVF